MKKEDLKPGDSVYMRHDTSINYTYFGEWDPAKSPRDPEPCVKDGEYGIFAYNPAPSFELKTLLLPYAAVQK